MAEHRITTFAQLQKAFDEVYLLEDRNVLKLVIATIIANQMALRPVWLMLVTPPSGGKTAIIDALKFAKGLNAKPLCVPISDLTINTFASGQKKVGEETSLLHKMSFGSIMTFKDFTSMISKNKEAQTEILGQLREIYDCAYVKRTGNSSDVEWVGKVGAIAGCTEAIYENLESLSVMGDRFIMYNIAQPDRMEVAERALLNDENNMLGKETELAEMTADYIHHVLSSMEKVITPLDLETKKKLITLANFSTIIRSGVVMDDRKGIVKFAPRPEMPMRMASQLFGIAMGYIAIRKVDEVEIEEGHSLSPEDMQSLVKIAFSSIPIKRVKALMALSKYRKGVGTAALATTLNYQSNVVGQWLAQLNALQICKREKRGGPKGDMWYIREEYRDFVTQFEDIEVLDEELDAEDDQILDEYDKQKYEKEQREIDESFNEEDIFNFDRQ